VLVSIHQAFYSQRVSKKAASPEISPEQAYSPELLMDLHILTRDGKLNQDSRRKLKQVEHLNQLVYSQIVEKNLSGAENYRICDVGAGKNYFSLLLWDRYFRKPANPQNLEIFAVESRPELSEKSQALAKKIGFEKFHALAEKVSTVGEKLPDQLDLVVALHACDTATDDAILLGLEKNAKAFVLIPCCQAEVATKLDELPKNLPNYSLWRHPFHRREFGSHLTNVLRSLFLESQGYRVRSTEFVGLEHSLKNEVIMAEKVQAHNGLAQKSLENLLSQFPIKPYLLGR
jgi:hypothetical protein